MAYQWPGMRQITLKELKDLHQRGELAGYYKLFPDGSKAQIEDGYTWHEITEHYKNGGYFGCEIKQEEKNFQEDYMER